MMIISSPFTIVTAHFRVEAESTVAMMVTCEGEGVGGCEMRPEHNSESVCPTNPPAVQLPLARIGNALVALGPGSYN